MLLKSQATLAMVVMEVDSVTGKVTRAYMEKSTGHTVLDDEAISVFSHWRFKPRTVRLVRTPITFTKTISGKPFCNVRSPEEIDG